MKIEIIFAVKIAEREVVICIKLCYYFFKEWLLKSDNSWMIAAKLFLESNDPLISVDG